MTYRLALFFLPAIIYGCNFNIPLPQVPRSVPTIPVGPVSSINNNVKVSTTLDGDMVKPVIIENSNVTLDCAGHVLQRGIQVRSRLKNNQWIPTENVTVKNCILLDEIRVYGMARNGEGSNLTASSRQAGHTERVQAAAPRYIRFVNNKSYLNGSIGYYFAPGVTHSEILNGIITGVSSSTSIYFDAESAYNKIANTRIDTQTSRREEIAVDGSAHNQIVNNVFTNLKNGGIYLYRNCGEGGNTRHQTPSYNLIAGNTFHHDAVWPNQPAVWLASRNGFRLYCGLDNGVPFGSGISDLDYATHNIVENNLFINKQIIRVDAQPNTIRGNRIQQ